METHIQYATTSDGVSIAYAVVGAGPPIVCASGALGDLHLYSSGGVTPITQVTDTLAGLGWRVIMYDGRGMGSSERGNTDFSLDGRLRDLEAVIERTGVDRFALWGRRQGGPVAIAYAVNHPDRVSRLVLGLTYAKGADYYQSMPAWRIMLGAKTIAEEDWEYYTLALANSFGGFRDSDLANRVAAQYRAGISARAYLSYSDASEKIDVTDLLPLLSVPTLVFHIASMPMSNVDLLRGVASRIPNARLITTEDGIAAIDAFLREGEEQAAVPPELPSGTAIILFADIVDSTALTERLGDTAFRASAPGRQSKDRRSETAYSPSSPPPARPSRRRSPAAAAATTPACPSTSASTPATSFARRTTSTAGPSTSPRASAGSPRRAKCSCRAPCVTSHAPRPESRSRTAGSTR